MDAQRSSRRLLWLAAALFLLFVLDLALIRTGLTLSADGAILRALRVAGRPDLPGGPRWIQRLMMDVTVLGGGRMLTLLTIGVAGFFVARRSIAVALMWLGATCGGSIMVSFIKKLIDRPRPEVVTHLVTETSFSFPSAHSANSAIAFLMLAGLVMRLVPDRATRRYTLGVALFMMLLIGLSRLYLGVHWPTDVLAGWSFGAGWALLWLAAAERLLPPRRFETYR